MDLLTLLKEHTPDVSLVCREGVWTVTVGTVSRMGEDVEAVLAGTIDAFLFIQAPVNRPPAPDGLEVVLAKVKSLLAKAESTESVEEAASCARLAQGLLFKHRLDMADLAEHDDPIEDQVVPLEPRPFIDTWRFRLFGRIARMNGCRGYAKTYIKGILYHMVGKRSDLSLAQYVLVYLIFQIEALCRSHAQGKGRTWANNFRLGAVDAITSKMKEAVQSAKKEAKKTPVGTTALVKLDRREVEVGEWVESNLKLCTHKDPDFEEDEDAWMEGYLAGGSMEVPSTPGSN